MSKAEAIEATESSQTEERLRTSTIVYIYNNSLSYKEVGKDTATSVPSNLPSTFILAKKETPPAQMNANKKPGDRLPIILWQHPNDTILPLHNCVRTVDKRLCVANRCKST
jgi:hypothetical protein